MVFNVVEAPGGFSDDREDITEYTVLLNIYISSDRFVDTTETIRNLMKEAGFIKKVFPTAQWDETLEVFNQPMEFLILK